LLPSRRGGDGVLFPDVPSADTLVSPVGKTHHRVNSVHWSSVRWTKEYAEEGEPESNEQEEPEEVHVNWTHGLPFENSPKPSKRKLRLSIQKQLKSHRRALKRYRRNLRVDKKGTAPSAAEESPAQDNPPHEPVNPSEDTSTSPAVPKPDSDSDEEISDSDSSPKEDTAPDVLKNLREDLRKAILACLYYRNKYLKRLRLIALNARKHLVATPDKTVPTDQQAPPVSVHDPEVEHDRLAFTKLELWVSQWDIRPHPSDFDYYGRSHREMSYLAHDFNWIAYSSIPRGDSYPPTGPR
jgi:hypothetical protein